MNLSSSLLFAVIAIAFAYTFYHLVKKVYGALKRDGGESGCNCCSGKRSHCAGCGGDKKAKMPALTPRN